MIKTVYLCGWMLVKPVDAKPNFVECLFSIFLKSNYSKFQLDSKQRAIALWLPSIILKQVSASYKIAWRDVMGYCFSYFLIILLTLLSAKWISHHYQETNLNKAYKLPNESKNLNKSQENLLLNQCSNQSDNSQQKASHQPAQRGTAIRYAG